MKSVILVTFVLMASLLLFGCAQQAPAVQNQTTNETKNTTIAPVTNTTNITEQPAIQKPVEKNDTVTPAVKNIMLDVGFSSNAGNLIGKGLSTLNTTLGNIEIRGSSGWITLSGDPIVVDLALANTNRQSGIKTQVAVDNYSAMRWTVLKATSLVTTNAAIPGVVAQQKETALSIVNRGQETSFSLDVNDETETYSLTAIFDIDSMSVDSVTFDPTAVTARARTYSKCRLDCNSTCKLTNSFTECYSACNFTKNRDCDVNSTVNCLTKCNCPGTRCDTADQEQCKIDCIKAEKEPTFPCRVAVDGTCNTECTGKLFFSTCTSGCMKEC